MASVAVIFREEILIRNPRFGLLYLKHFVIPTHDTLFSYIYYSPTY